MQQGSEEFGGWFWQNLRSRMPFRLLAAILVVALTAVYVGREGLVASNAASAKEIAYISPSAPSDSGSSQAVASRMSADGTRLRQLLEARRVDVTPVQRLTRRIRDDSAALDQQFDRDREILEANRATEALQRLRRVTHAVDVARASFAKAADNFSADPGSSDDVKSLARALNDYLPENALPAKSSQTSFRNSRQLPTPVALSAGTVPAYGAPTDGSEQPSPLPRSAEAGDLAETRETKITPAIQRLADQLNREAPEIFTWVRNNVAFQPYYGIRKGADGTLAERSGSAADQAALTVALLRASAIPARFVRGVVEMPIAQAANWIGIDPARAESRQAVVNILAGSGIPVTQVNRNGLVDRVRFEQTWAEALVASDAYRGAAEDSSSARRWVPLDASVKTNLLTAPSVDAVAKLRPSAQTFAGLLREGSAADPTTFQVTRPEQVRLAAQSFGADKAGLDHVRLGDLGWTSIKQQRFLYLPGTLPLQVRSVLGEYRGLPDSQQTRVDIEVSGSSVGAVPSDESSGDNRGFTYHTTTAEIANKRVTIAYTPAGAIDADVIDAYHGLLQAPAYAGTLVPVLRIDGRVVGRASVGTGTGYQQRLRLKYYSPGFAADTVDNALSVGSLSALTLDLGAPPAATLLERADKLRGQVITRDDVFTDRYAGEMLSIMGSIYFTQGDRANAVFSRVARVAAFRQTSGAITSTGLSVATIAGFPVRVALGGLTIDVDQDVQNVVSLEGSASDERTYMETSGSLASYNEALAVSTGRENRGISTATVLGEAARTGVAIRMISAANASIVDSLQQPEAVKQDIRSAIASGAKVTVPERQIDMAGTLSSAWVVRTDTGADYRVAGGLSGGLFPVVADLSSGVADVFLGYAQKIFGFSDWVTGCLAAPATFVASWVAAEAGVAFLQIVVAAFVVAPLMIFLPIFLIAFTLFVLWVYAWFASTWNAVSRCIYNAPAGG